jgi:hypothetical protein
MITRILTVSETTDPETGAVSPVVPGAFLVIPCADNHFKAVGPEVPNPSGRGATLPCIARLWRESPGRYAVTCEADLMARLDKTATGKTFAEFALSAEAAGWSCKDGIDNSPCILSMLGLDDPRPVKRAKPTEVEPIE